MAERPSGLIWLARLFGDLLRGLAGALIVASFFAAWLEMHLYTGLSQPQTGYRLAVTMGYAWLIAAPLAGLGMVGLSLLSLFLGSRGRLSVKTAALILSLVAVAVVLYLMADLRATLRGPRPRFFDMTAALGSGAWLTMLAGAFSVILALSEPGPPRRQSADDLQPGGSEEVAAPAPAPDPLSSDAPITAPESDRVSEQTE